ncbi:hypothetical protein [Paenibacillus taichungensis]|uniref:hypothetical protein n=1 Tax=Paenibacillus taichungensis TaxID=484184 RepID=UPI0039A3290C
MKTNADLISDWITEQQNLGKTDEQLDNKAFYDGSDIYTIKKSRKKGVFDLRCTIGGAVSLETLRSL